MDDEQIREMFSKVCMLGFSLIKFAADYIWLLVWYNPRCALAFKASQIHQKVLLRSIHVSGWFICLRALKPLRLVGRTTLKPRCR